MVRHGSIIVATMLTCKEMTEPLTIIHKAGADSTGDTREYGLTEQVTVQDVDQEVRLALASLACTFSRRERHGLVTYFIYQDSLDMGRLVIAPPSRVFPYVRIREHYPTPDSGLCQTFEDLCYHVHRDLEALCVAAEQVRIRENALFSYPRAKRRQIVQEYRAARMNGEVENKEIWAQSRYHICRKTLWRYECEFPESESS